MQKKKRSKVTCDREAVLAACIKELASELRLIDVVDLVTYVRTEQFGNIAQLVNASAELYYKPGIIAFGSSGDIALNWGTSPAVLLDMEFRHRGISAYFRLQLEALQAGVEITYISFANPSPDPAENTSRFLDAIDDCRLTPLPRDRLPASLCN